MLKPTGSLWVNLGDKYSSGNSGQSGLAQLGEQYRGGGHSDARAKRRSSRVDGAPPKSLLGLPWRYAIRCVDELGLILRAEVIWSKPNGLPESVRDRVRRSHETWFHFVRSPRYFSAVDAIREAYSDDVFGADGVNPLGKLPGSVWTIATQPLRVPAELGIDHFAAFPMEWPRRIIAGWSPTGATVLDPFGGTGTTALVAKVLGRHGISVDASADYCRLAEWRVNDERQIARAQRGPATKGR